jgi:vitamin B12 transporter
MRQFLWNTATVLIATVWTATIGADRAPAQTVSGHEATAESRAASAALQSCAAGEGPKEELKRAADRAEQQFRKLLREDRQSVDLRVGLAQVLIRCQLPHANVTGIMSLVAEAESVLRSVLDDEPEHWNGRFTLAVLLRNMPAMLGRSEDAEREFERLIAQQGRRAGGPQYALPYLHLGDLHAAAGRKTTAVETWRRGLALVPGHTELVARLTAAGAEAVADTAWLNALGVPVSLAAAVRPVYAFAPLRAEAANHQFQETRAGTTLRRLDVYTMPGGTGEMLQALQALPGATRAGDGAELYIRGGDPAETPVFFDGGRLAFPGRWESLQGSAMGVVDASVLRRAYFSSGGFSARYGNALSGIVDVETEGRPAKSSYRLGANMVQAGGTLRTQLGEHTGFWTTLSGTDTRLINRMTGETDLYGRSPQSVQGIGGISYEPLPGVELRSSVLALADRYARFVEMNGYAGEFASRSTMQHASLSGRALRSDGRRGVSGSLTASRRESGMSLGVLDRDREDRAVGGRLDLDAVARGATRLRTGAELLRYDAVTRGRVPTSPALTPGSPAAQLPELTESAWHAGAYVEAEHSPAPGLAVVAGLRADALPGESGAVLDPRVGAAYSTGAWTLRAGAGVFHQGSWRARYRLPDPGQPSGVPRRAEHVVAGLEREGTLSVRAEAYIKRYGQYTPGTDGPAATAGSSTGVDAIARWSPRTGPGGWISYSLLRGRVELEGGDVVPSALDVTHSVTSVLRLPLGAWEFGATQRYATGKPFTPMTQVGTPAALSFGAIHSERLPAHRRLDARVTRYMFGERRMALTYLEMLNLLDRRNVMSYTYAADSPQRVPINSVFAHRTLVLGVELQFD